MLKKMKEYILEILVILLIIVIGLYIINYAESFSSKAVNLITSIAAAISTFFLFLAFRQSKLSNDLKISEPFFNKIVKEISDIENKSNENAFSDPSGKLVSQHINYSDIKIRDFTYQNFAVSLLDLITHIEDNTKYPIIIDSLLNKRALDIKDVTAEDYKGIRTVLDRIRFYHASFMLLYTKIYMKYSEIHNSDLNLKHKKFLFEKLDKLCTSHDIIHDIFRRNQDSFAPFRDFKIISTYDDDNVQITKLDYGYLLNIYDRINEIKTKYN
jgi:hypothetical protein